MNGSAAIVRLLICLFIACLPAVMVPQFTPPGNIWRPSDTLACAILIAGALYAGPAARLPLLFLVYGMVGGLVIGMVFLPDGRDWIRMKRGEDSYVYYGARYCAFVVFLGLFCRTAGNAGAATVPSAHDTRFCRSCSYNLTGNTSGICPECGKKI